MGVSGHRFQSAPGARPHDASSTLAGRVPHRPGTAVEPASGYSHRESPFRGPLRHLTRCGSASTSSCGGAAREGRPLSRTPMDCRESGQRQGTGSPARVVGAAGSPRGRCRSCCGNHEMSWMVSPLRPTLESGLLGASLVRVVSGRYERLLTMACGEPCPGPLSDL